MYLLSEITSWRVQRYHSERCFYKNKIQIAGATVGMLQSVPEILLPQLSAGCSHARVAGNLCSMGKT